MLFTSHHDYSYVDYIARGKYPSKVSYDYEPKNMDFHLNFSKDSQVGVDPAKYRELVNSIEGPDTAEGSPYLIKKQRFKSIDFEKGVKELRRSDQMYLDSQQNSTLNPYE